ncbi:uncharacterized protein EKO05_0006900 [Ascochyta rabiei]|uniref:Uncharacterized protein n=1 Tax=Didymella rabiei TaxID=5454 RepID=A0A162Z4D4_DIDRA|nr:uncharacterized protein EKO05_0006900 [Ascochyta rabiei]KZM20390.1 hypothetical protein ST47_g8528 [Ascochyta rabiei]UPX16503.1 hypothetical protein EKO05_0006900 [Ascochyta rabiei]
MPATPKSFLPAFTGFIVFAFTYTFIEASKEGAAMDNARTRWQHQHASARNVLSGGVTMLDAVEAKIGKA